MAATLKSRIPEIQVELPAAVGAAIHKGAADLAEQVRERAPVGESAPHLKDSIQVTDPKFGYTTRQSAGVSMDFYWYFLEYGTAKMAPRPFVRPAVEAAYPQIYADVQEALKAL